MVNLTRIILKAVAIGLIVYCIGSFVYGGWVYKEYDYGKMEWVQVPLERHQTNVKEGVPNLKYFQIDRYSAYPIGIGATGITLFILLMVKKKSKVTGD